MNRGEANAFHRRAAADHATEGDVIPFLFHDGTAHRTADPFEVMFTLDLVTGNRLTLLLDSIRETPRPGEGSDDVRHRVLTAGGVLADAVGFALDIAPGRLDRPRLVRLAREFFEYLGGLR